VRHQLHLRHPRALFLLLMLLAVLILTSCGTLGGTSDVTPSDVSPTPTATPRPADPNSNLGPQPIPDELQVSGLFADPRPRDPDVVAQLGPRPASSFPIHDERSVVLYDIHSGETTEFGPGPTGLFTSDGAFLAWTEFSSIPDLPAELRRIDLPTGNVANLGTAGALIQYEGGGAVRISGWGRDGEFLVNLANGSRLAAEPAELYGRPQRYRLTERRFEGVSQPRFTVWDGGTALLRFDADRAVIDDKSTLVALVSTGAAQANIFLIDILSGQAEFIATTDAESDVDFPLAANRAYVVWTPNYCGAAPGATRIYDRETGQLTELSDARLWVSAFAPGGRLVDGPFGGEALVDVAALAWDSVLQPSDGETIWSPDYRYASRGITSGTRTICS
jgi:hypothetical protein